MTQSKVAGLLESLTRLIPGISGYQAKEKRRSADKAVREKAAGAVIRCRGRISRLITEMSRNGDLASLKSIGALERVAIRLERLEDELRHAAYGYTGFFDEAGVGQDELALLYEFDIELLSESEKLEGLVPDQQAGTTEGWLQSLSDTVGVVQRSFEDRKRVVERKDPG
ncbi:MAG TPA: hypothetical protein ENH32_09210 [Proteobacteria bacterium]|nr:hypothetical protein BMS3Abin14_00625 [bacterium BMS3Abin14]HDL54138.1 hypothetical protein [Pseudomonadota bacterium]